MEIIKTIFYFLVVISVLVVIHELGHFLAARISKMRVDIFSLFMGYRIFGYNKKTGFTFGNLPEDFDGEGYCDYRFSLIPFGGYVKISGMIDESFDTKFATTEPQPYEFRAKNPFQKAFAISGGVIMNLLLAWGVFALIVFSKGDTEYLTTKIGYVDKGSITEKIGLMAGDEIISINGKEIKSWNSLIENITIKDLGDAKDIRLIRNSATINVNVHGDSIVKSMSNKMLLGIYPENQNLIIMDLETMKGAGKAGIKAGDTLLLADGHRLFAAAQLRSVLQGFKDKKVFMSWKRDNTIINDSVKADADGLLGIQLAEIYRGPKREITYGLISSIGNGWTMTLKTVGLFWATLEQIFSGNMSAKTALGGPIMIAKQASQQADMGILNLLNFIALLSVTLAVINILPFPALDGGHLVIIIIEGIFRKEIPLKIKMGIQQVGFFALMALMAFVIYNDIVR